MSKRILNIYYRETLNKIDSYEEYLSSMNLTLDAQLWEKSLLANNERAYQEYLNEYPKGNYRDEAQLKINALNAVNEREEEIKAWNKALNKNTKSSYEKYLMNYYNGLHNNEAKRKVDEFIRLEKEKELEEKEAWKLVCKKNTKEDYENYLKFYPRGIYCYEAESEISKTNLAEETILWDKVSKKDNEKFYKEYLNKYPNGMYLKEAKKYLKEVSFEITRDCDDCRFFIFFDDNKQGVRALNKEDKNHNHYFSQTIEPIYLNIKPFSNGLLLVENQNYEEALFTRAGYEIFKFGKYRLVEDKGENKTNITLNKNATVDMSISFIKFDKQVLYNEKFMQIFNSSVKKIIDTRNLTFGYIGGDEELLIEPILEYVSLLKNGLGIAKIKNTKYYHLIDRNYEIKLAAVNYIESEFINGLSIYERDNQFGLINEKGEVLTNSSFNNIILTKVGISIYEESGYYGLLTSKYRICSNVGLDFNKIVFIEKEELFVLDNGYIGFANNKGEITIPCEIEKYCFNDFNDTYQKLFYRNEFIKVINRNGKEGLINSKGEYQIQPLYDKFYYVETQNLFQVHIGDKNGLIDINGKTLLKLDKYEIRTFYKKTILIKKNNLCGLLDFNTGATILPIKYHHITVEDIEQEMYRFQIGFKYGLVKNGKIIIDLVNMLKFNSLKKEFLKKY